MLLIYLHTGFRYYPTASQHFLKIPARAEKLPEPAGGR